MIDIYDEVGYIKEVLEKGVSEKWERDSILLVRYYKMLGDKRSVAKQKIREKCERSTAFYYNHLTCYKRLNKIVDTAWKKEVPLREIKQIEFSREVLDWFLNLEDNYILSDEQVADFKFRRPKISIKKNKAINWNRTKYLFTLFVWSKVQENYLDKPNMHYLKNYNKRFQEDADLKPSFNMQRERDYLYDLGLIHINFAIGIDAKFIENDVFKVEVTDENRVILAGEDLYKCGYWLEKQKMGSFICQHCNKEIAHYTKSKQEQGRKYCKPCALIVAKKVKKEEELPAPEGYRYCEECGELYELSSSKDFTSKRCPECQEITQKEKHRLRQQKYIERKKNDASQES